MIIDKNTNLKIKYYASFRSYKIPYEPIDELSFASTENLATYYIGLFDNREHLVRFKKIIAERTSLGVARLIQSGKPGEIVYVRRNLLFDDNTIDNSQAISYENTEDLQGYLIIEIFNSGTEGHVTLVYRAVVFDNENVQPSESEEQNKTDVLFIRGPKMEHNPVANKDNYPYWLVRARQVPPPFTAVLGAILLISVVSSLIVFAKIPVIWGVGIFILGIVIGIIMINSSKL